ncbi:uncharacterized protein [Patagioenas fasciata]|uniref:uncharacterized protein isoform X2 n=1 Tax=Patagioenas fasciata TaxID=372321 RepID=UPI003A99E1A9
MVQLGDGRRAPLPAPTAPPAFSIDSILQPGPRHPAREQGRARCTLPEEEEKEEWPAEQDPSKDSSNSGTELAAGFRLSRTSGRSPTPSQSGPPAQPSARHSAGVCPGAPPRRPTGTSHTHTPSYTLTPTHTHREEEQRLRGRTGGDATGARTNLIPGSFPGCSTPLPASLAVCPVSRSPRLLCHTAGREISLDPYWKLLILLEGVGGLWSALGNLSYPIPHPPASAPLPSAQPGRACMRGGGAGGGGGLMLCFAVAGSEPRRLRAEGTSHDLRPEAEGGGAGSPLPAEGLHGPRQTPPREAGGCVGESGKSPAASGRKKTRTIFSKSQVFQLESTFDVKRYLSSAERAGLAAALHLTETQCFRGRLTPMYTRVGRPGEQSPVQTGAPRVEAAAVICCPAGQALVQGLSPSVTGPGGRCQVSPCASRAPESGFRDSVKFYLCCGYLV